jgi:hypothetical protein
MDAAAGDVRPAFSLRGAFWTGLAGVASPPGQVDLLAGVIMDSRVRSRRTMTFNSIFAAQLHVEF